MTQKIIIVCAKRSGLAIKLFLISKNNKYIQKKMMDNKDFRLVDESNTFSEITPQTISFHPVLLLLKSNTLQMEVRKNMIRDTITLFKTKKNTFS